MIRRVFRAIFVILIIGVLCKACLVRDVQTSANNISTNSGNSQISNYPSPKNVLVNGIDYLQSQAPIGNFGGEIVFSSLGEGPKTFNPFNSKDNTSSTMSAIMYDGLLSTDPITGHPSPKLANRTQFHQMVKLIHLL